jgi:hypothetical protein
VAIVVDVSADTLVKVTPSVDVCHCHVDAAEVFHVPLVAVRLTPINVWPEMTGATVFMGGTSPGVRPLPEVVDAPASVPR